MRRAFGSSAVLLGLLALGGCQQPDETIDAAQRERLMTLGPLDAPPASRSNAVADDEAAAELGAWLFNDDGLSLTGTLMSCIDCHQPALGWSDDRTLSRMANGNDSPRHSQTLTNVAYQPLMFWNGRSDSVWAQAFKAMVAVHGLDKQTAVAYLHATADYPVLYAEVFGELPDVEALAADPEVTEEQLAEIVDEVLVNCAKAIEAFERTLISTNSPLDQWIAGNEDALTEQQKRGAALFVGKGGCIECHSGPNLSDGWFHNIGLAPGTDGVTAEAGLAATIADATFNTAGKWSDDPEWGAEQIAALEQRVAAAGDALIGAHKTPTLRDVAMRPRFGHNGDIDSLTEWIARYSTARVDSGAVGTVDPAYVPRNLSDAEIADLVAFMDALTGDPSSAEL
ncbi:MAG TPA: cytochrome c peroxidase [Enhygromyxa sp.]|nr:cytochrome c peroxidase [Enhygromyxa sp.]